MKRCTSYENEISCIKDCNNVLLHISNKYATEFTLEKEQIIGQDISILGIPPHIATIILKQEDILHNSNKPLDLIYVHKKEEKTISYLVRKRLLKNPFTNNTVGIHVNMEAFVPGHFRKIFLKLANPELIVKTPFTTVLTKAQNEIAFCLLLGF